MKRSSATPALRRGLLAVFVVGIFIARIDGQPAGVDVNVRSSVEPPRRKNATTAARTFAIYPATEIASPEAMVRPLAPETVDEIYTVVQEKLVQQGFVGVEPKQRPDILVTIRYGRSFLASPWSNYAAAYGDGQSASLPNGVPGPSAGASPFSASAPRVSIVGLPTIFVPGREAKQQAAVQEKLFFTVAAFEFESMHKGKTPVKLWETTMNVDDPDHRDLNKVARQMLMAGSAFFGRKIAEPELEIATAVREGRVEVGVPRTIIDRSPVK